MERKIIDAELVFGTMDAMVDAARQTGAKTLPLLLRDRLIYLLVYGLALRVHEVLGLDLGSFKTVINRHSGQYTLMVDFHSSSVRRGAVSIPVLHDRIAIMLHRYLEEVRPILAQQSSQDEQALFLSSRGKRLTPSALLRSFRRILKRAGLEGKEDTLGNLRYTAICRIGQGMSASQIPHVIDGNPLTVARFDRPNEELREVFASHIPEASLHAIRLCLCRSQVATTARYESMEGRVKKVSKMTTAKQPK